MYGVDNAIKYSLIALIVEVVGVLSYFVFFGGDGDFLFVLFLSSLVAMVLFLIAVGELMEMVAKEKCYDSNLRPKTLVYLFGIIGVLVIIALPDKSNRVVNAKQLSSLESTNELIANLTIKMKGDKNDD